MTSEQPGTSGTPDTTRATPRRPAWVVGSIAAAVLLTGGGTAYWASTAHGDGRKGDSAASAPRDAAAPTGPGIAPGEPDPAGDGVTYTADVTLPDGPGTAPAFAARGEVASAEVARLAAALGLSGAPRLTGELWQVGEGADGSGPLLTVNRKAPGTWNFSRFQVGGTGDDCVRGKDTCGPATLPQGGAADSPGAAGSPGAADSPGSAGSPGSAAGSPVSEEAAKAAAAPVLAAAGQGGARLDARLVQGSVRVVSADPVVGGLPTQGWSTRIGVGADSKVVTGSGELTAPVRAAEQPVTGAVDALARLNDKGRGADGTGPGPGPSACATSVPLVPDTPVGATDTLPCNPEPRPMKPPRTESVRGAELGLVAGTVDGGRGLVPAWLFEVAGKDGGPGRTVAQPAAVAEDPPASAAPPAAGRTVPGFSYSEADRTLTVNFWGGVCSTYALEVREQPETVMTRITDTPNKPGQSCIMIAQEMTVTAKLQQPLGDRKVIDATTGKPLARQ